tara:strand:+ start:11217 stop:11486 length:270 start_codon:yes stop_codon:yes gene_type:complete
MLTFLDKLARIAGLSLLFGAYTLMILTFFAAYFNGGQIMVSINSFGEQGLELGLLLGGAPFVWYVYRLIVDDEPVLRPPQKYRYEAVKC